MVPRILTNKPVFACALAAGAESAILLTSRGSIFREGFLPSLVAFSFLLWFWLTVALFGQLLCRWFRGRPARDSVVPRSLVAVLASLLALVHIGSWTFYMQAGQFANYDTLLFLIEQPSRTIWRDLGPGLQRLTIAVGAGALFAIPAFTWLLARPLKSIPQSPQKTVLGPWLLAMLVLAISARRVDIDISPTRREMRQYTLVNCVSPQLTLVATFLQRQSEEPIHPTLNTRELDRLTDWSPPSQECSRPSVIFVMIEAMRADVVNKRHQEKAITPNLNRLARSGLNWTKAYSQSTHSDYSDVCIVSSLYPLRTPTHHYYQHHDPWPRTLAFDVFKQAGYETAIISSQNESWGGMDRFLETPNLDLFYDAERSGARNYVPQKDIQFAAEYEVGTFKAGKLNDDETVDVALEWISEKFSEDSPFFLAMNFQASHFPYLTPEGAEDPFQPSELTNDIGFMNYPVEKAPVVRNAYYNGLHYCDHQLGRLIEVLRKHGKLDDTILVVMGENGEAFHENGSVGHAQNPVEPAIHVATVMHGPKHVASGVENYPLELIDVLPTVLGVLGWNRHPNFQGVDVLSEERPPLNDRLLFFHANSPAANCDAVQWAGRWKYMKDRRTGREFLRDVERDPTESRDFSAAQPEIAAELRGVLARWRQQQLAYYRFPMYYEQFYPPKPPRTPRNLLEPASLRGKGRGTAGPVVSGNPFREDAL